MFQQLYPDIQDVIISKLNVKDLYKLSRSNRHFQTLCDKDDFWKTTAEKHNMKICYFKKKRNQPKVIDWRGTVMNRISYFCDFCYMNMGKRRGVVERRLCDECNALPQHVVICKSTAKSRYCLTDNELEEIDYTEVTNPHFKCASNMKLYLEYDVLEFCAVKYGSIDLMWKLFGEKDKKKEERKAKREANAAIRRRREEEAADERRRVLLSDLADLGLELRRDSRLCNSYIEGDSNMDSAEIACIMYEMKFLFRETNYSDILDDRLAEMRRHRERYDFDDESHFAKERAIKEWKQGKSKEDIAGYRLDGHAIPQGSIIRRICGI